MLSIEKRLFNIENLVNKLALRFTDSGLYNNADLAGTRQSIGSTDANVEQNTADIDYIMMMEDL